MSFEKYSMTFAQYSMTFPKNVNRIFQKNKAEKCISKKSEFELLICPSAKNAVTLPLQ